jgi:DNA-binding NarL/FixJ family response regulator
MDYSIALTYLVPNAQWALDGNDYTNIQWFSEDIAKPTDASLKTAYGKAISAQEAKVTARASALAKLAELGLTQEEIAAL